MRLVIARCSVEYAGRLSAYLPSAVRLLMVKADGCVAIHADGGAYKPLNWMNAPNHLDEREGEWVVTNVKGETLTIRLEEVISDVSHELGEDPGLFKDGVEKNLQAILADRPWAIEEGLEMLEREYFTDLGPVDLLCRDESGQVVAVEIKRKGEIAGVEQLTRYLDFLNRDATLAPVRGILAATSVTPQARTLATDRGIGWVEVDYDGLRGVEGMAPRLFDV
jgi:RecB family endonuclease NucS